jgi:hypothetical protein
VSVTANPTQGPSQIGSSLTTLIPNGQLHTRDPNITHFLSASVPRVKLTKNEINSLCRTATMLQAGGNVPGGASYGTASSSPSDSWPDADMAIPSRSGSALAYVPIDPGAAKMANYAALASIGGTYATCVAAVSAAN